MARSLINGRLCGPLVWLKGGNLSRSWQKKGEVEGQQAEQSPQAVASWKGGATYGQR
jgi:hypothetical protein